MNLDFHALLYIYFIYIVLITYSLRGINVVRQEKTKLLCKFIVVHSFVGNYGIELHNFDLKLFYVCKFLYGRPF